MGQSVPSETEESTLAREVVQKIATAVLALIRGMLDRWVVISTVWALTVAFVAYIWLLPPEVRIQASPGALAAGFGAIIQANLFALVGWGILLIFAPIAVLVIHIQHRRIKRQGAALARFRDQADPSRLSAGDRDALLAYPDKLRDSEKPNG
jgi:hypothetical protein